MPTDILAALDLTYGGVGGREYGVHNQYGQAASDFAGKDKRTDAIRFQLMPALFYSSKAHHTTFTGRVRDNHAPFHMKVP